MFCRKCGNEIPDDSLFCLKCGSKVELIENKPRVTDTVAENEENLYNVVEKNEEELITEVDENVCNFSETETIDKITNETNENVVKNVSKPTPKRAPKPPYKESNVGIWIVVGSVTFALLWGMITKDTCEAALCISKQAPNSKYCVDHTCKKPDCSSKKYLSQEFCYKHTTRDLCDYEACTRYAEASSKFCNRHTCAKDECNKVVVDSEIYCENHMNYIDDCLDIEDVYFTMNSVGRIEITFKANNKSNKEIKYVHLNLHLENAVGDDAPLDGTGSAYVDVELIGPVKSNGDMTVYNEYVGYSEKCATIDINSIMIYYTDGSIDLGPTRKTCKKK